MIKPIHKKKPHKGLGHNLTPASFARLQQAISLHQAGRLQQAEHLYKQILSVEPAHADANHLLGVIAIQSGNNDAAIQLINRAIKKNSHQEAYFSNLGVAYENIGMLNEAVTSYLTALKINPNYVDALANLGNSYLKQNKLEEAITSYQKTIQLNNTHAEAHNNLGTAYTKINKLDLAVGAFKNSLQINPNYLDALINLGHALQEQGKITDAAGAYQKALRINPQDASVLYQLGNCLELLGFIENAVTAYQNALQVKPDCAEAYCNLGNVLLKTGKIDEAVAAYYKAINIKPDFDMAYANLASLYEITNNQCESQKHVENALKINPLNPSANRIAATILRREEKISEALEKLTAVPIPIEHNGIAMDIHSELGKLHDRANNFDKAFHHFTMANLLQQQSAEGLRTNKNRYLSLISKIRTSFPEEGVNSWTSLDVGSRNDTPVFLVGFPRSGTTLLDQILDSHPMIQVMEEKPIVDEIISTMATTQEGYPLCIAALTEKEVDKLRTEYLIRLNNYIERKPGCLLVDKLPLNIVHCGLIYRIFPDSKIVLAIRHPYDVCLSNFMQSYVLNDAMANFSSITDASYLYDRVMGLWQQYTQLLPLNYHTVKYEALVENFEFEVRNLLDFLSVGWDDSVSSFSSHALTRKKINTPSYNQVTESIYNRAKYRWTRYEKYMEPVKGILKPYIEYFGYQA